MDHGVTRLAAEPQLLRELVSIRRTKLRICICTHAGSHARASRRISDESVRYLRFHPIPQRGAPINPTSCCFLVRIISRMAVRRRHKATGAAFLDDGAYPYPCWASSPPLPLQFPALRLFISSTDVLRDVLWGHFRRARAQGSGRPGQWRSDPSPPRAPGRRKRGAYWAGSRKPGEGSTGEIARQRQIGKPKAGATERIRRGGQRIPS
ncbi:hypothetical protein QBC47DRAFT_364182 [Echria macrotheca]|uniref:Uncharacterized protein n=1 Tax=Echria macrotheca TaxID=438768 RepID=A0AAJ0B5D0_9PEZI|nr:hypothetical protein QBC47DRAFT_364182 [Echria macrotheca]